MQPALAGIGGRGIYQPPDLTDPEPRFTTDAPGHHWLCPCDGLCCGVTLGSSRPPAAPTPRAELRLSSSAAGGQGLCSGASAPWLQPQLGEKVGCWRSSQTGAGHQSRVHIEAIAERYGTTVQTLRRRTLTVRPTKRLSPGWRHAQPLLAGRPRTRCTPAPPQPQLLRADGHLCWRATHWPVPLALRTTTRPTLREYNLPDLDRYPRR